MCDGAKLRLLPVIIMLAALISGLVIYSYTPGALAAGALAASAAGALFVSAMVFLTACVICALCGFRRTAGLGDDRGTGAAVCAMRVYAPAVLINSLAACVLSLIALAGAFALLPQAAGAAAVVALSLALSAALVYFAAAMIFAVRG
jgi:hypothetical protein